MKKLFLLLCAAAMLFILPSCGGSNANSTSSKTSKTDLSDSNETLKASDGKSVVVYFSWSGNTKAAAEEIAKQTGSDIFEISPKEPYTKDYNELLDVAQNEKKNNVRPEIAEKIENISDYDTVYIGYPNWWADMPMIMYTFFDTYDLSGKTIMPFCTSGGSGFSDTISAIEKAEPNASVKEGLHIRDLKVNEAEKAVTDWLNKVSE